MSSPAPSKQSVVINRITDLRVTLTEQQNINLNKDIETFVEKMTEKDQSVLYYKEKRNTNTKKAAEDIFLGKKSEFLTLLGLHKIYGFPLVKPDMEIRVGCNKGWEKDLAFRKKDATFPNVHVKSCSRGTYNYCNDYSWTFQYSNNDGNFGRDDIFNDANPDLVALVFLETPQSKEGIIKAILPWVIIRQYLKDPKKKSLIGLKKCLYYKDLLLDKEKLEKYESK